MGKCGWQSAKVDMELYEDGARGKGERERKKRGRKRNKLTGNIFFAMFGVMFLYASKRSFFCRFPFCHFFCMKNRADSFAL